MFMLVATTLMTAATGLLALSLSSPTPQSSTPQSSAPQSPAPERPPAAVGAAATSGPRVHPGQVLVTGRSPTIRLLDKPGGTTLSEASFWQVSWSPAGPGRICYLTIGDERAGGLRVALTDNEALYRFITDDVMAKIFPEYTTRPFRVVKAVITTTSATAREQIENCRSAEYNVDLIWRELDAAAVVFVERQFQDLTQPATPIRANWVRIPARAADIIINGQKQPGQVYRVGEGARASSTANVIFGDDWYR